MTKAQMQARVAELEALLRHIETVIEALGPKVMKELAALRRECDEKSKAKHP
jgi:division protein CdvB (Snf7/Vps24/ESCRT-III family)